MDAKEIPKLELFLAVVSAELIIILILYFACSLYFRCCRSSSQTPRGGVTPKLQRGQIRDREPNKPTTCEILKLGMTHIPPPGLDVCEKVNAIDDQRQRQLNDGHEVHSIKVTIERRKGRDEFHPSHTVPEDRLLFIFEEETVRAGRSGVDKNVYVRL